MPLRLILAALALALAAFGFATRPAPDWQFATPRLPDPDLPPAFETLFTYVSPAGMVQSPAILAAEGGDFAVVWFDGPRTDLKQGRVLGVTFAGTDGPTGSGDVAEVVSPRSVSGDLTPQQTVLSLGPAIGDGAGGLFASVASFGGWSASSVAHLPARDGVFGTARVLNLTPLLARTVLVTAPAIAHTAEARLLPALFGAGTGVELITPYGMTAYLDGAGRVRGLSDLRGMRALAAPAVVPLSGRDAIALMGSSDPDMRRILLSRTTDGGENWGAPEPLDMPNPATPVAALRLSTGALLMAYNPAPDRADTLALARSGDGGRTWVQGRIFGAQGGGTLRDPMLQTLGDGRIALTYSVGNRAGFVVTVFTQSWAMDE